MNEVPSTVIDVTIFSNGMNGNSFSHFVIGTYFVGLYVCSRINVDDTKRKGKLMLATCMHMHSPSIYMCNVVL